MVILIILCIYDWSKCLQKIDAENNFFSGKVFCGSKNPQKWQKLEPPKTFWHKVHAEYYFDNRGLAVVNKIDRSNVNGSHY